MMLVITSSFVKEQKAGISFPFVKGIKVGKLVGEIHSELMEVSFRKRL